MPSEAKLVTAASLMTQVQPFMQNANELQAQAERAEIITAEDFGKATDFVKICSSKVRTLEDTRIALTKPIRDHVTWINDQIKPITEGIKAAKAIMSRKGTAWKLAEDERVRKEAEEEQRKAEEQALADAEEAQAQGDKEKAEAIVEAAAATPEAPRTAGNVRGGLTGATGGLRKTWVGEVGSVKDVCLAISRGELPEDLITVSKSGMNTIARNQAEEGVFYGIKITEKAGMNVR